MLTSAATSQSSPIFYPESDGKPMADNTLQLQWIFVLVGNLMALFRERADVFVGGNQNWYPVEREPDICAAPDAYVVFGRPKGHRASWKQWEEANLPMTVVFEVLSPGNTGSEMADKYAFYEEHGVEEYYLYDPDGNRLHGFVRRGEVLIRVRQINGFVSPRLGIRFDLSGPELVVRYPDGRPFLTFDELDAERARAEERTGKAEERAELLQQRAEKAEQRAELAEQRAERLAALTEKHLRQEATAEETLELESLLQQRPS